MGLRHPVVGVTCVLLHMSKMSLVHNSIKSGPLDI